MNRIDYIRQASIAELKKGFRLLASVNRFDCLFCGYHTEQGVIYQISPDVFYDAEKAMCYHISQIHESPLQTLLQLDKRWTGLTELQTRLVEHFAAGNSDQRVMELIGAGSISTIRNHRFLLREKLKQAKVLFAISELIDQQNESQPTKDPRPHQAESVETQKVLSTYFPQGIDGPLATFPSREKRRLIILRQITTRFAPDQSYAEKEVNAILSEVYADHVLLRRLLIDYGFLTRRPDGSEYRLAYNCENKPGKEDIMSDRKKELIREYKETPRPMGVFQIKNSVNGKILLLKALDIPGIINRHRLDLSRGVHRNHKLQADWIQYGADSFSFDILATLKPEETLPEQWPKAVADLLKQWMEKLQPFEDAGYHKRK
jgi:hypothetical protein